MTETYDIHDVTDWPQIAPEQMGTKSKFWCRHPDDYLTLFKQSRTHHGEHWSEKVAAELAGLVGVPHAEIELATHQGSQGTISRDFTRDRTEGSLIHGNELLFELDPNYPSQGRRFGVAQHTLDRIFRVIQQPFIERPSTTPPDQDIQTAADVFVGYLMLDSLIANTDRHHANWGILLKDNREGRRRAELAPTFDHASSLGRELTDDRRREKLRPLRRDQTIIGYLEKSAGRSRIYALEDDSKPLRPLAVFERVHQERRPAAEAWLNRLDAVPWDRFENVIERIPAPIMSGPAREFALRLLELNREALLNRSFRHA